jgi:hypothetical protein
MQTIIAKGPFIRFAWGIATDNRLNHHPQAPNETNPLEWQGRVFAPRQAELYLRVERQTLHGFAHEGLVLFTIRTYIYDINWIRCNFPENLPILLSAVESMSSDSLTYKGVSMDSSAITSWLKKMMNH